MRTIVISGGSGTLGSETAGRLAKDNKVIILGRTEETLKETAQELGCVYLVCDVTDEEQVAKTVDVIIDRHKKIDVLINNAGAYISGPLEDNEPEEIRRIMEIDALGPMLLTRAAIPYMKEAGGGLIVNVVSTAGITDKAKGSVYHAAKFAANGFTGSIAKELKPFNIRVSAIYPGSFGPKELDSGTLDVKEVANGIDFIVNSGPNTVIPKLVIKHLKFHD